MGQLKNRVVLVCEQNIPETVSEGGRISPAFSNRMEAVSETMQEVSVENVANWALCQLKRYMTMKRLQGKTGFKLSKEITVSLTVNGRTEIDGMKFSLNAERLEKAFQKTPKLVGLMFTTVPNVGGLTTQKAMNFVFGEGKQLLAAAKKEKVKELPAPQGELHENTEVKDNFLNEPVKEETPA